MINVLIKDDNNFYSQSILRFVTELFQQEFKKQINVLPAYDVTSIGQAQIIIISLCEGEHLTCFPELFTRGESIIIGIVERAVEKKEQLPQCIKDIALIERGSSLETLSQIILSLWREHTKPLSFCRLSCSSCAHKKLSFQQFNIMTKMYSGKNSQQIASELNLSEKTIFAHKYVVMTKFSLRNDYDLVRLLKCMEQKNVIPNEFRERLVNEHSDVHIM